MNNLTEIRIHVKNTLVEMANLLDFAHDEMNIKEWQDFQTDLKKLQLELDKFIVEYQEIKFKQSGNQYKWNPS